MRLLFLNIAYGLCIIQHASALQNVKVREQRIRNVVMGQHVEQLESAIMLARQQLPEKLEAQYAQEEQKAFKDQSIAIPRKLELLREILFAIAKELNPIRPMHVFDDFILEAQCTEAILEREGSPQPCVILLPLPDEYES